MSEVKNQREIHSVRDTFILEDYLKTRADTLQAINNIASRLELGMSEKDGVNFIDAELKSLGVEKKWHPTKFRIGENTLCSFSEKSLVENTLTEGEIFFLDIGPVWNGYEGDMGRTYIYGDKLNSIYRNLQEGVEALFNSTKDIWKRDKLTGKDLYDFAATKATELGFELNLKMSGHRLGGFPHHLFYRGKMIDIDEAPIDNLWVLEILIKDTKTNRGAFFEDILSANSI